MTKKTKQTTKTIENRLTQNEPHNYEHINWLIPSDLEDHYLLNCTTICVDIESQTATDDERWKGHMFGTSYVADITLVAIHADGYPTCVIDFLEGETPVDNGDTYGCEGTSMTLTEQYELRKEFIRRILTRPGITIVGHNIVFDLRSLGGHFGFNLLMENHAKVWDTMTMGNVLLLSVVGEQTKLDFAAMRFNLIGDDEAKAFYNRMKDVRFELHTVLDTNLMRYGAMDTQVTYRYYLLQLAIIAAAPMKDVEPFSVWDEEGKWAIQNEIVTGRPNRFISSKGWPNLPTLIEEEQGKLWISACMAIQGMKLDIDYVTKQHQYYTEAYADSLERIMDMMMHDPSHSEIDNWTLPFVLFHYYPKNVDTTEWVYGKLFFEQSPPDFEVDPLAYEVSDDAMEKVAPWLPQMPKRKLIAPQISAAVGDLDDVQIEELHLATIKQDKKEKEAEEGIRLVSYFAAWIYDHTPQFQKDADGGWKSCLKAAWYSRFLTERKIIPPAKLVNRVGFKLYYTFVLQNMTPPTNEELQHDSYLLTPQLKDRMDAGKDEDLDFDWRSEAMRTGTFSMSDDAFEYYFGEIEEETEHLDALRQITQNMAKVTRINEFLRHAGRDGKIHSVVAPKAQTGRATHVTPNVGNLPMEECKGYLVTDDPSEWVQWSIDLSNAENFFSGLTFGDNAQIEACVTGDYHYAMLLIYKYTNPDGSYTDEYKDMLREISTGSELGKQYIKRLKHERKWYKKVTFSVNYGAGAPKVARTMHISYAEAKELISRKESRFAATTSGKIDLSNKMNQMYQKGYAPPFCVLWTGRRIPIDVYMSGNRAKVKAFTATNYTQQGGVGEVVYRAMIRAQEEALKRGLSLRIVNQVHDEIVCQSKISEFWEGGEIVIRHLQTQIPQEYLNRTIPACRMLAVLGPENKDKWGYDTRVEYPIDQTKFINFWGIHDMPEGETEAPVWQGNLDEGYSVEQEIIDRTIASAHVSEDASAPEIEKLPVWAQFSRLSNTLLTEAHRLEDLRTPVTVTVNEKQLGPFLLPERMAILTTMAQRGHVVGNDYQEIWGELGGLVDVARDYVKWYAKHSPVPTPKEKKAQQEGEY